jgi:hypothetical protein
MRGYWVGTIKKMVCGKRWRVTVEYGSLARKIAIEIADAMWAFFKQHARH